MKFDLPTLAFVLSLICITQVIALFIQFNVDRTFRGTGWWLLGSALMALGFISFFLKPIAYLGMMAVLANPMLVLGRIFFFIGSLRFVAKKENKYAIVLSFLVFAVLYYYFLFFNINIAWRTIVVSASIAGFSFLTAHVLFFDKSKNASGSYRFTASIFLIHGCYLLVVISYTLFSKPLVSYLDYSPVQIAAFIVPIITSTLWTFGFILMVNQRLSRENREERENLQRVFNTGPDAALITRMEDGLILDINLGFSAMIGFSRAEVLNKTTGEIQIWHNPTDRQRFMEAVKASGACENLEFAMNRKDGTHLLGATSARVITIHNQPCIISVTRDITDQKRAEADRVELEAKNRQLLKAESLGRMAGAIAHHFNNQLQSVMANLELMGERAHGVDPVVCLARAKLATERAANVSRLLLSYLGQNSREQEPKDLSELCRNGMSLLESTLPKTVVLEMDCPSPGPVIRANLSQIQQVLTNLVTNAWESMECGIGLIRLRVLASTLAEIPSTHRFPIDWQPQGSVYACLEVSDNGGGISEKDIEKLYDPFFSTKFTGRGLGLSVVLGILQAHGGAITVESRQGRGTIFRLFFPICSEETSTR